jgi:signal transduction histidine kinase
LESLNIYRKKTVWKLLLLVFAIIIGFGSLFYTSWLVEDLKNEEREKAELLAEATRRIISENSAGSDLDFLFSIIDKNTTVPVIWADAEDNILSSHNFDSLKIRDASYLPAQLRKLKSKTDPILIEYEDGVKQYIYYKDSVILTRLIYYPYVQLAVILLFISISYFAFSMSRKAEQNQVWVGLSRETAHQLGTPTSSLSGWVELLRMKYPESELSDELSRDVERLEKISDRFSKIGSVPELDKVSINDLVGNSLDYLKLRSSSRVDFSISSGVKDDFEIPLNSSLFEWVIENLCKNSIDAMDGEGKIDISIEKVQDSILIDISDTGKGIPKTAQKNIFKPGYTTKERGWGLGLSLTKRIIEIYHKGKIFVRHSEPGKGTTIRIILNIK